MKTCPSCKIPLPPASFYRAKEGVLSSDGLSHLCKECHSLKRKERNERLKEERLAGTAKYLSKMFVREELESAKDVLKQVSIKHGDVGLIEILEILKATEQRETRPLTRT